MKRRGRRSEKELVSVSEHLKYEIEMLFWIARAGNIIKLGDQNHPIIWAIDNARVESFPIHLRNLLHFLYRGSCKANPDDVIAEDFFDTDSTWLDECPPKSQLLAKSQGRANKEVAHLTYTRLRVRKKRWLFENILSDLSPILERFSQLVPNSRVKEGFCDSVSRIISRG